MVLKILTISHNPNAAATNVASLTKPSSTPYLDDSNITDESRAAPTAIAANPACQPMQMQTAATATSRPDGSLANNARTTLAALIAAATARRCFVDVSSI